MLDYSETINAVVDERRHLKGALRNAWDAAWTWKSFAPGGNRVALPEPVFLALLTVALSWGQDHLALLLGVGFLGLLRPHEIRQLRFCDFQTPKHLGSSAEKLYVTIAAPKMRRVTAKRSYTRIDEIGFVNFANAYVPEQASSDPIFSGPYSLFRDVFIAMLREVGLPTRGPLALTWGSLRPGGATWLLRVTDSPEAVRFRGRWTSSRMLEIYVQEIGAVAMLPQLPPQTRQRILDLAALAPALLAEAAARY